MGDKCQGTTLPSIEDIWLIFVSFNEFPSRTSTVRSLKTSNQITRARFLILTDIAMGSNVALRKRGGFLFLCPVANIFLRRSCLAEKDLHFCHVNIFFVKGVL